ncbi:hypothetical protein [Aestuariispira insulae]|uniref:Tryptophan synthase subunit beta like protein n=1 Tax=Aestuariispira insulae TaxID=1461337 RepID=A0A3D9HXN1_9PROT|nr:hypothetical protein [Aestuariispira insulae]RED54263.1 hypothetical protein DFP90_1011066 [Aestuariispira insulae]
MPYVIRDGSNEIIGLSVEPVGAKPELLPDDHPDVVAFRRNARHSKSAQEELLESDLAMARIIEDLIDVLISKNIINFTDLPLPAQRKLTGRQKLRSNLSTLSNLVADQDDLL